MAIHPHPMSMAAHGERRRQELLDQARQVQAVREATAGAARACRRGPEVRSVVAGLARSLFSRLRLALTQPLDLPQSSPGEAR